MMSSYGELTFSPLSPCFSLEHSLIEGEVTNRQIHSSSHYSFSPPARHNKPARTTTGRYGSTDGKGRSEGNTEYCTRGFEQAELKLV